MFQTAKFFVRWLASALRTTAYCRVRSWPFSGGRRAARRPNCAQRAHTYLLSCEPIRPVHVGCTACWYCSAPPPPGAVKRQDALHGRSMSHSPEKATSLFFRTCTTVEASISWVILSGCRHSPYGRRTPPETQACASAPSSEAAPCLR